MSKPGSFPRAWSSPRPDDDARQRFFFELWNPEQGSRGVVTGLEDTIGVFRAGKKCEPVSSIVCAVHAGLWQAVTELPDIS